MCEFNKSFVMAAFSAILRATAVTLLASRRYDEKSGKNCHAKFCLSYLRPFPLLGLSHLLHMHVFNGLTSSRLTGVHLQRMWHWCLIYLHRLYFTRIHSINIKSK